MTIYIFYKTNNWYEWKSYKPIYITDDIEVGIAQCQKHLDMTDEQAKQIREIKLSKYSDDDYEWVVESYELNTFIN